MLENPSNPLKTHIIAYFPIKTRVKKMILGVGVQGPMTSSQCKKNMHKHTHIM